LTPDKAALVDTTMIVRVDRWMAWGQVKQGLDGAIQGALQLASKTFSVTPSR